MHFWWKSQKELQDDKQICVKMHDSEEIIVPSLSSRLQETLFLFQQKRYLCDVAIVAANGFIPAHRVVLVAGSQYFHNAEAARNSLDPTDLNFHLNYDIEDVRRVLNLLYTGKMIVTKFNVDRIAAICAELRITEALEKCLVFMTEMGLSNNVAVGSSDLTERLGENHELNAVGTTHIDPERTVNTAYTDVIRKDTTDNSALKRKCPSFDDGSEKGNSPKKTKRAYNRKVKKTKNSETKISNDQCKDQNPRESVITIQPYFPSEDNENIGDSSSNHQQASVVISENSQLDSTNATREVLSTTAEGFSNSQPCMFLDFKDLQVYQSQAPMEKITKQFDPDGAITEAMEKDQEFLEHVEKRLNCRKCKMMFKDVESLTQHRRDVHPSNFKKQRFVCDICNAKPNNHVTLVEHKFKKHGLAYDKTKYPIYKCPEEGCEFETIVCYKLSEHKTTVHSGLACMCETCGRAFKSKSVLKYHIQSTHSESRPTFICNTCGKTYFTAQALKRHMENHSGTQKRLLCHLCPYSSVGRQELNNHLLKVHNVPVPKKTKVYQCDNCDYYSLNRTQFRRHVALHNDREKAFKCSECDKAFPTMYNLKSHEKRHKAETINCPYEGCKFFTKFKHILKNHITGKHTNTNFKPFKCHLCDHSCKLKGNLNKHLVNKHGLEVMTEVKQRKIALETGQGYTEILVDRAKSRIANTIPSMFPQQEA